jgi:NhaP-type Na+/H+ or K+/H+ antiporter
MLENLEHMKDEFLRSDWLTYLGVMGISFWGGIVSYLDKREPFNWRNLTAHISSSSFAGMMTFMACEYAHISGPLTGVLCGVAAHMGTPALIALAMRLKVVRELLGKEETK